MSAIGIVNSTLAASYLLVNERRNESYLYVSEIGFHPYQAMNRIMNGVTRAVDFPAQVRMNNGKAIEELTFRELSEQLNIKRELNLWNTCWSGRADGVVDHGEAFPVIIEHKAPSESNFRGKIPKYVPRTYDVLQAWMYGQLYEEKFRVKPQRGAVLSL